MYYYRSGWITITVDERAQCVHEISDARVLRVDAHVIYSP